MSCYFCFLWKSRFTGCCVPAAETCSHSAPAALVGSDPDARAITPDSHSLLRCWMRLRSEPWAGHPSSSTQNCRDQFFYMDFALCTSHIGKSLFQTVLEVQSYRGTAVLQHLNVPQLELKRHDHRPKVHWKFNLSPNQPHVHIQSHYWSQKSPPPPPPHSSSLISIWMFSIVPEEAASWS